MSANVIETAGPSRGRTRASWTAIQNPIVSAEPDEPDRALAEQRQRRRVQKKQFIDRAQRLLDDAPPPDRA